MRSHHLSAFYSCLAVSLLAVSSAVAQDMPADYQGVLTTLGRSGDFKDGVLKVNIPRNDIKVTIGQRAAPTPFGFGGWVAFTKGSDGMDVMMGDLVLSEDEVNPVMSKLLDGGFDVTALHNHFLWDQPRMFFMHVHGMGQAAELATRLKPALASIPTPPAQAPGAAAAPPPAGLDVAALAKTVGQPGEQSGPVYKNHDREARHRSSRAWGQNQRPYGAEHLGGVRGHRRGRHGGWGCRDARIRGDAGPESASLQQHQRGRDSSPYDRHRTNRVFPALLRHRRSTDACGGRSRRGCAAGQTCRRTPVGGDALAGAVSRGRNRRFQSVVATVTLRRSCDCGVGR